MKLHSLITYLLFAVALLSCKGNTSSTGEKVNSIYYWRTTFSLNDAEREFLKKHDVEKVYMRFFDVTPANYDESDEKVIPEATIQFLDSVPDGVEIVPTVYITNDAMENMQIVEEEYAEKILKRVNAICHRNNIKFRELQLDCDWTKNTRKYFFRLCEAMKHQLDSTQTLSSTIRLHQLTQDPPPVDKGVLMVYNTGNLMELTTDNSIFSKNDIEPYLRDDRLSKYQLPLDVAYPAYGWSLVFEPRGDKYCFDRIMRRTDISDYLLLFDMIDDNIYEANSNVNLSLDPDKWDMVYARYRVKVERPTAKEILEVKKLIDKQLSDKPHNNILYHLDESQLSHYSDNEINKIYSHN